MKISIALCTYNGEKFIAQQLESFLNQTVLPDELIVCDDNSSDETLALLENFKAKAPFPVQIYVNVPNLGARENFAKAISLCTHELIFLSDQDDVWLPEKTANYRDFFIANPDCLLLFANAYLIDDQGERIQSFLWDLMKFTPQTALKWTNNQNALKSLMMGRNFVTGATVAFHSRLKESALPFPDLKSQGWWHDGWLALMAAALDGLKYLPTVLTEYRLHQNQQLGVGNGTAVAKMPHFMDRTRLKLKNALFSYHFAQQAKGLKNVTSGLRRYLLASVWFWRVKIVTRFINGGALIFIRKAFSRSTVW
jgi:glycosyltransferase involved in cell wall biosynthesis